MEMQRRELSKMPKPESPKEKEGVSDAKMMEMRKKPAFTPEQLKGLANEEKQRQLKKTGEFLTETEKNLPTAEQQIPNTLLSNLELIDPAELVEEAIVYETKEVEGVTDAEMNAAYTEKLLIYAESLGPTQEQMVPDIALAELDIIEPEADAGFDTLLESDDTKEHSIQLNNYVNQLIRSVEEDPFVRQEIGRMKNLNTQEHIKLETAVSLMVRSARDAVQKAKLNGKSHEEQNAIKEERLRIIQNKITEEHIPEIAPEDIEVTSREKTGNDYASLLASVNSIVEKYGSVRNLEKTIKDPQEKNAVQEALHSSTQEYVNSLVDELFDETSQSYAFIKKELGFEPKRERENLPKMDDRIYDAIHYFVATQIEFALKDENQADDSNEQLFKKFNKRALELVIKFEKLAAKADRLKVEGTLETTKEKTVDELIADMHLPAEVLESAQVISLLERGNEILTEEEQKKLVDTQLEKMQATEIQETYKKYGNSTIDLVTKFASERAESNKEFTKAELAAVMKSAVKKMGIQNVAEHDFNVGEHNFFDKGLQQSVVTLIDAMNNYNFTAQKVQQEITRRVNSHLRIQRANGNLYKKAA